jgi:hypothetical protein
MTDLHLLIEKYKKTIAQIEGQIVEVKHKHDVLVEASHLLEEEAMAPYRTLHDILVEASRLLKEEAPTHHRTL